MTAPGRVIPESERARLAEALQELAREIAGLSAELVEEGVVPATSDRLAFIAEFGAAPDQVDL